MVLTPLDVSLVSMMKTAIYSSSSWPPANLSPWPEPTFVYSPSEGKGVLREETGARQAEVLDAAADRPGGRCDPGVGGESAVRRADRSRLGAAGSLRDAGRS